MKNDQEEEMNYGANSVFILKSTQENGAAERAPSDSTGLFIQIRLESS